MASFADIIAIITLPAALAMGNAHGKKERLRKKYGLSGLGVALPGDFKTAMDDLQTYKGDINKYFPPGTASNTWGYLYQQGLLLQSGQPATLTQDQFIDGVSNLLTNLYNQIKTVSNQGQDQSQAQNTYGDAGGYATYHAGEAVQNLDNRVGVAAQKLNNDILTPIVEDVLILGGIAVGAWLLFNKMDRK